MFTENAIALRASFDHLQGLSLAFGPFILIVGITLLTLQ